MRVLKAVGEEGSMSAFRAVEEVLEKVKGAKEVFIRRDSRGRFGGGGCDAGYGVPCPPSGGDMSIMS